jgi:type VI secretion system protein ImpB
MGRLAPGLQFRVENTLAGDGSELPVQLKFNTLDDFEPGRIIEQVEPLRKLLDTRNRLRDLMNVIDRSEGLEAELEKLLMSDEDIKKLAAEFGIPADGKAGSAAKRCTKVSGSSRSRTAGPSSTSVGSRSSSSSVRNGSQRPRRLPPPSRP